MTELKLWIVKDNTWYNVAVKTVFVLPTGGKEVKYSARLKRACVKKKINPPKPKTKQKQKP